MANASLPMYDLPELSSATDAWWRGLARSLRKAGLADVPDHLRRDATMQELWGDPALMFTQTCGFPLVHGFKGVVQPIATPAYGAEGCAGTSYRSALVVRADQPALELGELRGRRCAVNSRDSQSGFNALRHAVAPLSQGQRFFSEILLTGGHRPSLEAVAAGRADIAAIDCVTYALHKRSSPALTEPLKVLAWTEPAPGLPYATRISVDSETLARLREGLMEALAAPDLASAREALLLVDAEVLPIEAYEQVLAMESAALNMGCSDLA
jgi:ABC-type phosphate/phosphonate transport system substrate-binding protein